MLATSHFLAAVVVMASPLADSPLSTSGNYTRLSRCVVTLIDQAEVPAREAGVLMALELEDGTPVKEGLSVREDQQLGKLDNADALARMRAAELDYQVAMAEEVKSKAAIQEAEATVKVAEAEVIESESINAAAPGSIPPTQLRRQRLTEERARMQVDVAKRDAETAQLTVRLRQAQIDVAQINLDRHRIDAPWDAVVVQLYKHVGEWVNAGEPILRIIHLDKLRVEGFLDINDMLPEEVAGRAVAVEIRLKDRTEVFKSVISYVSPEIEASGEYRVWAEVDNRSVGGNPILRPGMDAEMLISLDDTSVARAR